jgi:hypothetical protein
VKNAAIASLVTIITMGLSYLCYQRMHWCKEPSCDFKVAEFVEHKLSGGDGMIVFLFEKNKMPMAHVKWDNMGLLSEGDYYLWELEHD